MTLAFHLVPCRSTRSYESAQAALTPAIISSPPSALTDQSRHSALGMLTPIEYELRHGKIERVA